MKAQRSSDDWDWRVAALCRSVDPAIFFHPDGERGAARRRRQEQAKQVCAECPVAKECREHALRFHEAFGTWGGLSEDDRSMMLPARTVHIRGHRGVRAR